MSGTPLSREFCRTVTVLSDLLHLLKGFHCCPAKGDLSVCKDRLWYRRGDTEVSLDIFCLTHCLSSVLSSCASLSVHHCWRWLLWSRIWACSLWRPTHRGSSGSHCGVHVSPAPAFPQHWRSIIGTVRGLSGCDQCHKVLGKISCAFLSRLWHS